MSYKIPIFPNVNDAPLEPNEINNCNADYFIEKYNSLVDFVYKDNSSVVASKTVYLSSTGNDTNGGSTLVLSIQSFSRLEELLNGEISSELILDISGTYTNLDFSNLRSERIIVKSTSNLTFNGNILLNPHTKLYWLDFSDNITWNISNDTYTNLNGNTLVINGNIGSIARTTAKSWYISNGSVLFEDFIVNNSNITTDFIVGEKLNILQSSNTLTINSTVDFKLFRLDYQSSLYLDREIVGISPPLTKLVNSHGSSIILPSEFLYSTESTKISSGEYNIISLSAETRAQRIKSDLELLTGDNRLDASAIKNLSEIAPETVRDKLASLSGETRLDASSIKNINYINYYTTTSAEFFQPAVNNNVTISVVDSSFLGVGNYILIKDAGVYLVQSIVSPTSISVRNLGYGGNVSPGTQIINGKQITLTGKNGISTNTITTSNFILPAIGSSVPIILETIDFLSIGSILVVNNVDYFRVENINISTLTVTANRLGYYTATNSGTTITSGTKVTLGGLKGERGINSYTFIAEDFLQPAIFSNVNIKVDSTEQFLENTIIFVESGGYFSIESIVDFETLEIKNLGYNENVIATTNIETGSKVLIVGERGQSSFSLTTANFVTPNYGENVSISLENTSWLITESIIKISTGFFKIVSIDSTTAITVQFLDYSPLGEAVTINSLSKVIISGERGAIGPQGSNGLNAYTEFLSFTMPAVGSTVVLMVDNSNIFLEGGQVFIEGAGYFEVVSILTGTSITIKNIGVLGNASPTTSITPGKVSYTGKSFNGYFGEFVGTFTMPPINSTAVLTSLQEPEWLTTNSYLYIPTIGHLKVTDITGNDITLLNEYYSTNSIPTTESINGRYYLIFGDLPPDKIVAKTTANYTQPAIGNNISVSLYTTRWLTPGMVISGLDSGHYSVVTITNSTTVLLKNLGYDFNNEVIPGTVVNAQTEFLQVGSRGPVGYNPTYSFLTSNFTQPIVGGNVTIATNDTSWMVVGQGLSISGAGPNYTIVSIDSATDITIKNNGYENVAPTSIIVGNGTQRVSPGGIRGKDSSSFITTTANFTQPSSNTNVLVTVDRTDTINPKSVLIGPNSGYYEVVTINSPTTVTLKNLNYPTLNTVVPTTNVVSGETLTISGVIGPVSYNATYSTLQSNFVQPTINSNITATVNDTSWISPGQFVFIQGGGTYEVISVDTGTTLTIKNLGEENVSAGTTVVGSGTQKLSPAGRRGFNGSVSSGTYLSLLQQTTNPSLTSNSVNLFSKQDQFLYTVDSTGAEHKLNQDLTVGNALNNILGISTTSGINGLNLGTSNSIFGNNSLLNIAANGTLPSAITLSDELNTKKITLKAPTNANLAANYTLELPNNIGTNGYALVTDGIGKTSWVEITGGTLSSITDGTTTITDVTSIDFSGATLTQNGSIAEINISSGTLQSVTDGTTSVSDVSSIFFTEGAVITQNGTTAEIEVKGGGLETVYTNSATYNAIPDTIILAGSNTNIINLPSNPQNGVKITISDYSERFDISPITINPGSGNTIYGSNSLLLDTKYATVQLVFWDTKWVLYGTEVFSDTTRNILPPNVGTLTTQLKNANFTAEPEFLYLVDTSLGTVTVTLPENPPDGSKIAFSDFGNNFPTNNVTLNRSGTNTIDTLTEKILYVSGTYELVFYNGSWTTISSSSGGGDISTTMQIGFFYS